MRYLGIILLTLVLGACGGPQQLEKKVFVEAGEPLSTIEDFDKWEREVGFLQGKRANNMLLATQQIGEGDVEIRISFSLHEVPKASGEPDAPAMFVKLSEAYHLWVNFAEDKPDIYLLDSDRKEAESWNVAAGLIEKDKRLTLTIIKKENQLSLNLSGQQIGTTTLEEPMSGKIGIYPAKGMCRIFDFSAKGDLIPMPAEKPFVQVFERGEKDYNTFRIPTLQAFDNQRLLSFAEGRRKSRSDYGEIDVVMKTSEDGGLNWGPIKVVAGKGDSLAYNSPCLLFEPEINRLHLFCNLDRQDLMHYWSDDQGDTWSEAEIVKLQGGMPYYPAWRFFVSPGKALLLTHGPQAGRWVVPGYYQYKNEAGQYLMHAVVAYKDPDLPWQLSEAIDTSLDRSNECTAVELADGTLLMNIRTQDKEARYRWQATSSDGGTTWSKAEPKEELVDPICHANMIRLPRRQGKTLRLLFSNPANPLVYHRTHLTVRLSEDQGQTWPQSQLIHEGPSAYSAMALLDKDSLVVLFEMGYHYNYERIVLEMLPIPD